MNIGISDTEIIMCEKNYTNKAFITMQELMEQLDISDKTLSRMIQEGELPDFSYGSNWSKKKGWHVAVLERHAMEKYERSQSIRNACTPAHIANKDVIVMPLKQTPPNTDISDGNSIGQKQKNSEKKSNRRIPAYVHSRVAAGFVPSNSQKCPRKRTDG